MLNNGNENRSFGWNKNKELRAKTIDIAEALIYYGVEGGV
jgi:hypothetical protein